jgi:hypothetical protein
MAALGAAMRAGLAVLIVIVIWLPALARSQTNADTDTALTVAIHPEVSTILQLPDEIVHTWIDHHGEIRVARMGSQLAIRPRGGTRAGVEAALEVETRTLRRTFRLLVVERARDANADVLVLPVESEQDVEESTPVVPPVVVMKEESTARTSANATSPVAPPAELEPASAGPVIGRDIEPTAERAATMAVAPRFDLSVHAVVALAGTTALDVSGYEATAARRSHRAFGVRVAGSPRGAWWAVEANISGEWPVAPTVHTAVMGGDYKLELSGPWLRADMGMRARFGMRLAPTAYVGIGLQAHHRDIDVEGPTGSGKERRGDMPLGGVLALGLGLEYRVGNVSMGLELHVRQGVPADYRSVAGLLSVGCFLDRGE